MDSFVNRARLEILSELTSFPTIRGKDWTEDMKPEPGNLVSISCAQASKWYLSWVVETKLEENGFHQYLLKSIDDGELGWWSNVGIYVYSKKRVSERPDWKWDDKQYQFRDRWHRVCYTDNDAYIVLPGQTKFDGDSVTLTLRERYGGFGDSIPFQYVETFDDYKKVTKAMMSKFYMDGVESRNNRCIAVNDG